MLRAVARWVMREGSLAKGQIDRVERTARDEAEKLQIFSLQEICDFAIPLQISVLVAPRRE